ncbi:DNA mismatch repair protein Msh2 isoform X2 [Sitophilus oryzae]|uniref:DNA mismatch repair protein Msh2 isoform X2 n=1 Tax=Sitophilus oryzae TaxID=7048 RepID=A0A6J2YET9_SITOR|nr:DNA mismatch repair protein Msh2 isoform X2 [Sitophilus oryzae]
MDLSIFLKPTSTVRFFNRSDYYTLHGDDATLAANFTSTIIKYMGEAPTLSYVCLNKNKMEALVRDLLLVRQYRVEVYTKTPGKNNSWSLEFKGSPGNLAQFEEILFENANIESSNHVMAVKLCKNNTIAVSSVNTTDLTIEVCEFTDNECYTDLEALIAQIGPKECIIPDGETSETKVLKTVLERNGVLMAKVKKTDFVGEDFVQDLNKLLFFQQGQQRNAQALSECALTNAMGCLQALVKFLDLTGSESNFNQYRLGKLDVQRYVRLDNAALYALNAFPGTNEITNVVRSSIPKSHSLFGILNCCVTPQGGRLLEQWIKQPLKDITLIEERLDIVDCLVQNSEVRTVLTKDNLTKIPDLMMLSKKLAGKKVKLQDCYKLYQAVNAVPTFINNLRKLDNKCVKSNFIDPLCELAADMENFQSMIEELVDLDLVDRGEFLIKSSFNSEMSELHRSKLKIEEKMQKLLSKAADDLELDVKSIKLWLLPQKGYSFRITKKDEAALRQNKEYTVLDALTGSIRFTSDALSSLNEDYIEISEKYEEAQKSVVSGMIEVSIGYADSVRSLNMILAMLDVLCSFATVSVTARVPYRRPVLKPASEGVLKLSKVRHPCLENQEHVSYIPNDAEFDKNDKFFFVITGPNMGGKSTYIRSIGVAVLMAHIGCFVPCDFAEISLVDGILARVGADDCQLKGLSTFMLEMVETSTILKTATSNSLVIIDELGRGTSTYDGCGIAWAIAECLATEIKCFSLFATHFYKITNLSDMYPSVGNLHVSAITTDNTITPLYQVKEGESDRSYGIYCAKLAGFPDDVLKWSTENLQDLEHDRGMKYINDYEVTMKKKTIEEGDQIIRETLLKLKTFEDKSSSEVESLLEDIKKNLENSTNGFVKGLVEAEN